MSNQQTQNWLLLRGLSREAGHWGEFIPQMHSAFPSAVINTLDLPGSGQFHRLTCPKDISNIMEFVRQSALNQNLLQEPVTILALSMGGMVAWEWLQKYPDEIRAAVLINTSFAGISPFYQRIRWQSFAKFAEVLWKKTVYERELTIIQLVSNSRDHDDEIAKAWENIQLLRPVSLRNSLRQMIAAAKYRPSEKKPKKPVLLINSLGDRLVSQACSASIQDKWHLDMYTHPWAGHDLSLDDSVWLINRLNQWIDSLSI